jgi:hypothetical protein
MGGGLNWLKIAFEVGFGISKVEFSVLCYEDVWLAYLLICYLESQKFVIKYFRLWKFGCYK